MRGSRHKSLIQSDNTTASSSYLRDKDIEKAKKTLGQLVSNFTEEELKTIVTEMRFLVESWLDDFEKSTFNGKTLRQLLYEKNRL